MSVKQTAVIALITLALTTGFSAARAAESGNDDAGQHAAHRQEMMKKMEERVAQHLKITDAQRPAWSEYIAAREALHQHGMMQHEKGAQDLDAAAMAHKHADAAKEMAAKLDKLADATDKLEKVLSPEQKGHFDEMSRQFAHHGWHHHGHHRDGEHGDGDMGKPMPKQ